MQDPKTAPQPTEHRDRLALRRTHLANERTLLAYGRTALMLAVSGATLLKFGPTQAGDRWLAALLIGLAMVLIIFSLIRFARGRREIGL